MVNQSWRTAASRALAQPLDQLVGAKTAKPFRQLDLLTVGDLLHHLPRHLMAGTEVTDIGRLLSEAAEPDDYVALVAQVASVQLHGQAPRQRLEVQLNDGSGALTATFFGGPHLIRYWQGLLSRSERGIFAGKLSWFRGLPQLAHPAFVMITPDGFVGSQKSQLMAEQTSRASFIGLYRQTAKLPTWTIAACIDLALTAIAGLDDPLPAWLRQAADLMDWEAAFKAVHHPASLAEHDRGLERLLFDEAFAVQATMAYRRADRSRQTAVPRPPRPDGLAAAFDQRLPFPLTDQQIAIGQQLAADLARPQPMRRLLQGEVGSGKTVVALRAMIQVVDAGGQAVLLAPTEVLAQQHFRTLTSLLGDLGHGPLTGPASATEIVLVTGSATAAQRADIRAQIRSGQAGLIVGTHAVLADGIEFADLGLVVIDEQHRFGVEQRQALTGRPGSLPPHLLVMTATPIPRSVALTMFGDLDLVTLTQSPSGRAEVTTTVVDVNAHPAWVDRVWARVQEEVAAGRQVYVVAPRIDLAESGAGSRARHQAAASVPSAGLAGPLPPPPPMPDWLTAVTALFERLQTGPLAGLKLGLLHGRLAPAEKDATMSAFSAGNLDVVVATSVIEVGLDVANASMMVITEADRFGVSQLHQLRGRIGRGRYPGLCLFLTAAAPDSAARQRLDTVASTRDGFALAEADLAQRREGDVLGLNQSGRSSSLRLLNVLEHADIIDQARDLAQRQLDQDPELTDPGVADYVQRIESLAEADIGD
ncbi:MAG: ATP-dependent DNA helicase RecG [Propionibacteriaceae bacterium]|jgi:ATP-dependent DNA helicase RecG|nr:ATP-dependent DNA helicase RecG [Propionibacteriaceae bacterium]